MMCFLCGDQNDIFNACNDAVFSGALMINLGCKSLAGRLVVIVNGRDGGDDDGGGDEGDSGGGDDGGE